MAEVSVCCLKYITSQKPLTAVVVTQPSYSMGTGQYFRRVQSGWRRSLVHYPTSSAKVKIEWELYLHSHYKLQLRV